MNEAGRSILQRIGTSFYHHWKLAGDGPAIFKGYLNRHDPIAAHRPLKGDHILPVFTAGYLGKHGGHPGVSHIAFDIERGIINRLTVPVGYSDAQLGRANCGFRRLYGEFN